MRIMTSNIWGDYFGNAVEIRKDAIVNTYKKYSPDVIGIQEMTPGWYNGGLIEDLQDEYTAVEAMIGNYTPLLYKTSAFVLLERGWEKLTDTPDKSKSITWAVLKRVDDEKTIVVCNTHFWWKIGPEHDVIREINAKQLVEKMSYLKEKYNAPVFAFGDLNCGADSLVMKYFNKNNVYSSYELAEKYSETGSYHEYPVLGDDGKYHGTTTNKTKYESLDHIVTFKNDVSIKVQDVIVDQEILDATDHSPVIIDF